MSQRDTPLPERDPGRPLENQGLLNRFVVTRTDGKDRPGGEYEGCRYFVLDVDHDPYARAALAAYAGVCEGRYPALARDLREKWGADSQPAGGANPQRKLDKLHAMLRTHRDAAARRFGETGSSYDEGRRVAYDQAAADVRAMMDRLPSVRGSEPAATTEIDVNALAQEIRRVDGKHDLGAAALAEKLMPFLARSMAAAPLAAEPTSRAAVDARRSEPAVVLRVVHRNGEVCDPEIVRTSGEFDDLPPDTEVALYVGAQPRVPMLDAVQQFAEPDLRGANPIGLTPPQKELQRRQFQHGYPADPVRGPSAEHDQANDPTAEHAPDGFVLLPLRPTQAMRDVMDIEGWTWEDLLAAAEVITEEQYDDLAEQPAASAEPVARARGTPTSRR